MIISCSHKKHTPIVVECEEWTYIYCIDCGSTLYSGSTDMWDWWVLMHRKYCEYAG